MTRRELTVDEVAALTRWITTHGRAWKRALWLAWFNGNYGASRDVGVLQTLRNAAGFGPSWLDRVKVSTLKTKTTNEGSKVMSTKKNDALYGGIGGPDGGGSPWRPCRFTFNTGESWDSWSGECDGTTWNGWDNVRVRPDVHAAITARFGTDEGGTHEIEAVDGWHDYSNGFVTSREPENVCRGCEIEIDVGATLCDACKSEIGDEIGGAS